MVLERDIRKISGTWKQASAERRDLVPERCRSWSFQVVPGTSTTKNQIWNGTTRNKERPDFKKMGTSGTRSCPERGRS